MGKIQMHGKTQIPERMDILRRGHHRWNRVQVSVAQRPGIHAGLRLTSLCFFYELSYNGALADGVNHRHNGL